jgi:hypothetical protein
MTVTPFHLEILGLVAMAVVASYLAFSVSSVIGYTLTAIFVISLFATFPSQIPIIIAMFAVGFSLTRSSPEKLALEWGQPLSFVDNLKDTGIWILIAITVVYGVIHLVNTMRDNTRAPVVRSVARYEGFVNMDEGTLIAQSKEGIEILQTTLDEIQTLGMDTCNILSEVKDTYLKSYAGDADDQKLYNDCVSRHPENTAGCERLKLSDDQIKPREDRRKRMADQKFVDEQSSFAELRNIPDAKVVECFQGSGELNVLVSEMERLMSSKTAEQALDLCKRIQFTLEFCNYVLEKGAKKMEEERNKSREEFASPSNTPSEKAVELLTQIHKLQSDVASLRDMYNSTRATLDNGKNNISDVSAGDLSSSDLSSFN